MSLNIRDAKKGAAGVVAPAGSHLARCYSVIDLGTHTQDGRWGKQTNKKVRFSWELPEEKHVFDEAKGPQPFVVHYILNFTIGAKSGLLKMLQSWRGRAFKPQELEDFELKNVLGAPCLLTVVHNEKDGATYANVDNVAPVPTKWRDNMPAAINKLVYYEVEQGKNETYRTLPEWLREMINKCEEWQSKTEKQVRREAADDEPPDDIFNEHKEENASPAEDSDSMPF